LKTILENIIDKDDKESIELIKKLLKKNISKYNNIDSIILFGSFATGNNTEESDIDLCVLFKKGTNKDYEDAIFEHLLLIERELDRTIQCVFIFPEEIHNWDRIFLENILAEGKLLHGNSRYKKFFLKALELEPYQIITLNWKNLDHSTKMKLKRALYGYKTNKKYFNKIYMYQKSGIVRELQGIKLGKGSFMITENLLIKVQEIFNSFDIKFTSFRVWIQRI